MDIKTHAILKSELMQHDYGINGEYDIDRLFKLYTSLEIRSLDDLTRNHGVFYDFVVRNLDNFRGANYNPETKEVSRADKVALTALARHIHIELTALSSKYFDEHRKRQENFVNIIEHIVGNTPTKILDIGSGKIPYSSILLAQDINGISSMDKFIISDKSLQSLNVEPYNQYFTSDTNIDNHEFIIGKKPCTAIVDIVKKSTIARKPYFMELCSCKSPSNDVYGWQQILRTIDPHIKFANNGTYAYNLDTPQFMEPEL